MLGNYHENMNVSFNYKRDGRAGACNSAVGRGWVGQHLPHDPGKPEHRNENGEGCVSRKQCDTGDTVGGHPCASAEGQGPPEVQK